MDDNRSPPHPPGRPARSVKLDPGNKTNAGRWKAGQSGNPNGRPKSALESRLACRSLNDRTLAVLVALLDDADGDLRYKAACRIRDEANGKPVQSIQIEQEEAQDWATRSDAELLAIIQDISIQHATRNGEQRS